MKRGNKMIYLLFIIYVICASSGLVLFKTGTINQTWAINIFGINITLKMIFGIVCYGISFLLWLYIVSQLNLTFAMPLSVALVNTLVVIESCLVLKEKLTITQGIGIFIIIVGVIVMTYNSK